jgi:phosphoribosylanthranilate isomerase
MVARMVRVKVCGITSLEDAKVCIDAGVDAIGLNFWARSVRSVSEQVAREIVAAFKGQSLFVGVFVDASGDEVERIRDSVGLDCVQLHGDEPPELVQRFLPHAYKAVRVRGDVLAAVRAFPGEHVLLDAYAPGLPGGTGATFDWQLARAVAAERKLTLAGGLTPSNVRAAIETVQPYCVDVASGVESGPGIKDHDLVRAFVANARG